MKPLILLAILASPAVAQEEIPCQPRETMAGMLLDRWGETSVFTGYDRNGNSVEIFARIDGSWTMLAVSADGVACAVAAGVSWQGFMIPQGEAG